MINEELATLIPEISKHYYEEYPNEMCGIVVIFKGRYKYIKCTNIAHDRVNNFIIPPEEYAAAEDMGEVVCIVHSHTKLGPQPSQPDLVSIEKLNIPFLIMSADGLYTYTEPTGYIAPLYGRPFSHGILDCYSFVKDYYRTEMGIDLVDRYREDKWWTLGQNILLDNIETDGFIKITSPKIGDVILMALGSSTPNHLGVLVEDNILGHHMTNRLSSKDVYSEFYRRSTYGVYRHRSKL